MKPKTITSIIDLLIARLNEDREDIAAHDVGEPEHEFYADEMSRIESAIAELRAEIKPMECLIVDVDKGIAHVIGYFERNENEYGAKPVRYVEVIGCFAEPKRILDVDISRYGQSVDDGPTCIFDDVVADRTFANFGDDLPDGLYAITAA